MNNRALIGLSAAAMSALVATAVGCGEPQQKTYTPAEEPAATVEAPATTEAETTETEAAEPEVTEADKAEETAEPAADEKAEETTEAEGDKAEQADEKAAPAADDSKAEKPAAGDKAEPAADEKAEDAKADDKAEQAAPAAEAAALTDGEYTAEGKGIGGKVPVTVTVKDGKIAEVTVGDNSETQGIGSKAIEQLPAKIVEANGTEGVDAVSGASVTSKAIFSAADECLEQAGTTDVAPAGPTADKLADEAGALADGTYTASARCSGGIVPVLVTYEDGKAVCIEIENDSALEEDDFKAVLAAIIGCRSQAVKAAVEIDRTAVENAVAAAEFSVDAAIEAASAAGAPAPAAESGTLTDGTYTASGKGFDGEVPVTVTIEGGKIASVTVGYNYATSGIGSQAINQLPAKIVAANGTEGVDAVSGATVTSKAIFTAVNSCLKQAAS